MSAFRPAPSDPPVTGTSFLAPLTRLLAAQLRELPLHQFPCLRRRLGIGQASPTAAGSAHGVWFVPYRTTDELFSQQPLSRNGRRDSGSVLGLPTPTSVSGPSSGVAGQPGSAPATHHHLLEPDHPDLAPPDRSVLKDPFLHSGGHVLHDLLTDLHAMMQWQYADGEQVIRPRRRQPKPRPAAKRGDRSDCGRAWVSLHTHVLTLELSTATVVPVVSRLLASVAPPQVEPVVASRVIGAGDTTLPGMSMASFPATSPVSLRSPARTPLARTPTLARGSESVRRASTLTEASHGGKGEEASDEDGSGYSDDEFENDISRVGAAGPTGSSPSRSTVSPGAAPLHPRVSTSPRPRVATGASAAEALYEVFPMEAIVWQLMQQHASNPGLLVRCLTLLCTSSQWVVATGPQVPCVCGDGDGGDSDGSESGQPAWHFLIPRRLFADIMKRHAGSSTVVGVAALALAVGVLNTHRLAATSTANERLARLMTPSATEVWDMVQRARTAHRYDQLVMTCISSLMLATVSALFSHRATFGAVIAAEQAEARRQADARAAAARGREAAHRQGRRDSWDSGVVRAALETAKGSVSPAVAPVSSGGGGGRGRSRGAASVTGTTTAGMIAGALSEVLAYMLSQLSAASDAEVKPAASFVTLLQEFCARGTFQLLLGSGMLVPRGAAAKQDGGDGEAQQEVPLVPLLADVVQHAYDVLHGTVRNYALEIVPRLVAAAAVVRLCAAGAVDPDIQWHQSAVAEVVVLLDPPQRDVADLVRDFLYKNRGVNELALLRSCGLAAVEYLKALAWFGSAAREEPVPNFTTAGGLPPVLADVVGDTAADDDGDDDGDGEAFVAAQIGVADAESEGEHGGMSDTDKEGKPSSLPLREATSRVSGNKSVGDDAGGAGDGDDASSSGPGEEGSDDDDGGSSDSSGLSGMLDKNGWADLMAEVALSDSDTDAGEGAGDAPGGAAAVPRIVTGVVDAASDAGATSRRTPLSPRVAEQGESPGSDNDETAGEEARFKALAITADDLRSTPRGQSSPDASASNHARPDEPAADEGELSEGLEMFVPASTAHMDRSPSTEPSRPQSGRSRGQRMSRRQTIKAGTRRHTLRMQSARTRREEEWHALAGVKQRPASSPLRRPASAAATRSAAAASASRKRRLQRRRRAQQRQHAPPSPWLPRAPSTPVGLAAPAVWAGAKLPGDTTTFLSAMRGAGLGPPPSAPGRRNEVVSRTLSKYARPSEWVPVPRGELMRTVSAGALSRTSPRAGGVRGGGRATHGPPVVAVDTLLSAFDPSLSRFSTSTADEPVGSQGAELTPADGSTQGAHGNGRHYASPSPDSHSPRVPSASPGYSPLHRTGASSPAQPDPLPPRVEPLRRGVVAKAERLSEQEEAILAEAVARQRKRESMAYKLRGLFGFEDEAGSSSDEEEEGGDPDERVAAAAGSFGVGRARGHASTSALPSASVSQPPHADLDYASAAIHRVRAAHEQQLERYRALQAARAAHEAAVTQHRREEALRAAQRRVAQVGGPQRPAKEAASRGYEDTETDVSSAASSTPRFTAKLRDEILRLRKDVAVGARKLGPLIQSAAHPDDKSFQITAGQRRRLMRPSPTNHRKGRKGTGRGRKAKRPLTASHRRTPVSRSGAQTSRSDSRTRRRNTAYA